MNEHPLIYFIHMPKTGGSTLTTIIQKNFKKHEILPYFHYQDDIDDVLNKVHVDELKIIHGHYWFGLHEHFNRPFSYFTVLRHPVERVVSLYYYLTSIEGKRYDRYRNMTLDQFVMNKIEANIQTGFLSGNLKKPSVLKAVRNLRKHFEVVGTTEQFDETLFLLGKRYGWSKLHYKRVNVTARRPKIQEIPNETIQLIKKVHSKDLIVYRYAKKCLSKQLSQLTEQEQLKLRRFKEMQKKIEKL